MTLRLEGLRVPLADFAVELEAEIAGPVTVVCGPSGAGKTTLLETIAGLRRPQRGRIVLDGDIMDDAARTVHLPAPARRMGYVPQDLALFPHLSAGQNLLFGGARAGADAPTPADVIAVLALAELLSRPIDRLSGGERQRVALGRALISGPRLLLLDEPLAGLDGDLRRRVLGYLRRVRDEFAVPMLYVTHDAGDAAALAAEILVLERGRLEARGSAAEMLEHDPGALRLRDTRRAASPPNGAGRTV